MSTFNRSSIQKYNALLASRNPVPGGGSASALTGAMGVGLIAMVARYSQGRVKNTKAVETKLASIVKKADKLQSKLLILVDRDAEAYLKLRESWTKNKKAQASAKKKALKVSNDVAQCCYQAVELTSFLVEKGNPNLISDIEVALELLQASHNSAKILWKVNQ